MRSRWYQQHGLCVRTRLPHTVCCSVAISLALLLALGCSSDPERSATDGQSAQAPRDNGSSSARPRRGKAAEKRLATSFARSGPPTAGAQVDSQQAVARVLAAACQSARYRPTLVVWLLDISPSAMAWGRELHGSRSRLLPRPGSDVAHDIVSATRVRGVDHQRLGPDPRSADRRRPSDRGGPGQLGRRYEQPRAHVQGG